MKQDSRITQSLQAELELLCQFNLDSRQAGLKIHHDASRDTINAAKRLHLKGLISQPDGGYLTDAGIEAAEHAQKATALLKGK